MSGIKGMKLKGKRKKVSLETRRKMRLAHLGKPSPKKGKPGPKHTEETKEKIRQTNKRIGKRPPYNGGDKHWNWKGGISPENKRFRKSKEYILWREAIFKRDDYTCRVCFKKGVYLEPHHIKSFAHFPELRVAIDNGLTLCKDCHKKTDNYCGKNKSK